MNNEEQIIIDGVDVSKCEYACNTAFGKNGCKHPMMKNILCYKNPKCYFKQLARKTQECEDLRNTNKEFNLLNKLITSLGYNINEIEDIFDYEEFCEHIMQEQKELKKKAKALEEIEDFRKKHCDFWCEGNRIFDIINKVKDGE